MRLISIYDETRETFESGVNNDLLLRFLRAKQHSTTPNRPGQVKPGRFRYCLLTAPHCTALLSPEAREETAAAR